MSVCTPRCQSARAAHAPMYATSLPSHRNLTIVHASCRQSTRCTCHMIEVVATAAPLRATLRASHNRPQADSRTRFRMPSPCFCLFSPCFFLLPLDAALSGVLPTKLSNHPFVPSPVKRQLDLGRQYPSRGSQRQALYPAFEPEMRGRYGSP